MLPILLAALLPAGCPAAVSPDGAGRATVPVPGDGGTTDPDAPPPGDTSDGADDDADAGRTDDVGEDAPDAGDDGDAAGDGADPAAGAGAAGGAGAPAPLPSPEPGFLGGDDETLLAVICDDEPLRIERNARGTTISFRLHFGDGTSALYKPEQSLSHSRWEAEVATYRIGRLLGIHAVPPSCPRSMTRTQLARAEGSTADFRARLDAEVRFDADGAVEGMAMYWVPDLRDEPLAVDGDWRGWLAPNGRIPAGREDDAAGLSDMLLLDWLTLNVDRWTGGNVRRLGGADGPFVFIDNAAGFGTNPWSVTGAVWPRFRGVQRFRRAVVERLMALTHDELLDRLGDILDETQIADLFDRLDRAIARVDELIDLHGEDKVLVFE